MRTVENGTAMESVTNNHTGGNMIRRSVYAGYEVAGRNNDQWANYEAQSSIADFRRVWGEVESSQPESSQPESSEE